MHEQIESPNTSLQEIDLIQAVCGKPINRLGIGHGYESAKSGCIFTVLSVPSMICPLATPDWRAVFSCRVAKDSAVVHNVLVQHPIFASRLRSVRLEDSFFAISQNGDGI